MGMNIFHMLSNTLSPAYHISLLPACSSNRGPPGALLARASLACPALARLARLPGLARFLDNVPPWLVVLAAGFVSAPRNKGILARDDAGLARDDAAPRVVARREEPVHAAQPARAAAA